MVFALVLWAVFRSVAHYENPGVSVRLAGNHKSVTIVMVVATLVLGVLIPLIKVDTDPETMLSAEEPVRLFHDQTKRHFDLSDIVVVGIVNNKDPNGVFNPASLAMTYKLTEFAKTLRWPDEDAHLRPNIHYKVNDNLSWEMGANIFFGDYPNTFFGQFENNTNIYTGLRYSF